eukprot:jgi/Mesvir1/19570/Mv08666-RA.1
MEEEARFIQERVSAPIRERLKARVERVRKELRERYANEDHRAWCRNENVNPPPFVKFNSVLHIPYARINWRGHDTSVEKLKALVRPPGWLFGVHHLRLDFHGSSLLTWEKGLPGYISRDAEKMIDWKWLRECNLYLSKLPMEDLHMLMSYTYEGDKYSNAIPPRETVIAYNRQLFKSNRLLDPANRHHPLWVQFAREFRERGLRRLDREGLINRRGAHKVFSDNVKYYLRHRRMSTRIPPLPADLDLSSCHDVDVCIDLLENYKNLPADIEFLLVNYIAGLLADEYVADVIQPRYVKELKALIMNSPRTTKPMTTYRGTKTEYFLTQPVRRYYRNPVFISSSFDPKHATRFMQPAQERTARCCAIVLHIAPGSRCLPLFAFSGQEDNEFEVLLPPGTFFYHDSIQVKQFLDNSGHIAAEENEDEDEDEALYSGLHKFDRNTDCAVPHRKVGKRSKVAIVYAITPPSAGLSARTTRTINTTKTR